MRQRKVPVTDGILVLDSLAVVPGSVIIRGVDSSWYRVDAARSKLQWIRRPATDSVWLQYRVFPFSMQAQAYRYRYDSIAARFRALPSARSTGPASSGRFLDLGNMSYTGSFGRSLSFGNAQDVVVNSLFNLQMNGVIGDGIRLSAAISDNNIPIQPDGTTQQLNEFDRIWLQFQKDSWTFNIGDIDIREQPTYFMSYFKRQQGLAFETKNKIGKDLVNRTLASGAIAKGKFTRNVFFGQEGNQGPYRLTAPNNELYFVVLAGTERVFIDGVQVQRGEDQDYVINYNTGEIRFTPRQLISKDKRIQVEFEYADRNYLNSLLYLANRMVYKGKLEFDLGLYSNADAKNSPINQVLSSNQKQFLSELGDSIQQAYFPSASLTPYQDGRVLYEQVDTLVNGQSYRIYRYQPYERDEMYSLSFTDVGEGMGHYQPLLNAANGTVFEWVAPVNGQPQGRFAPVVLLVTPKKQQMVTAALAYALSEATRAKVEMGYSITDVNTFSSKDKGNDGGLGFKVQLNDQRKWQRASKQWQLQSEARYENVGRDFRPLERLRTVEFLRDWGLPFDAGYAEEQLYGASVGIAAGGNHQLRYRFEGYRRDADYTGVKHNLEHGLSSKGWQLQDQFMLTRYTGNVFNGFFLRPQVSLSRRLEKWKRMEIGGSYALEHNEVRSSVADTLLPSSFSFRDWKAFVRSDAARPNRWSLQWFQRANQHPLASGFVPLDVNNNLNLQLELFSNPKHQFRMNAGYRTLQVKTKDITNQQSDQTLLGRAEYFMKLAKGAVTGNLLYETGAGQEQQRNYSYVEVPAGRGEYTWIDYDADGIQQLNEFELAQFPDQARFVRIFTPTNQFVKAAYNTFNISLLLTPANLWRRDSSSLKRFLARWSLQSGFQTSSKTFTDGSLYLNPFAGDVNDSTLITQRTNLANTISYNRYSTLWGFDFTQVRNTVKGLLTYGFETRINADHSLRIRRNTGKHLTWLLTGRLGNQQLITPNPKFGNRNFDIDIASISPAVTYTRGAAFRMQLAYKWDQRKGMSAGVLQESLNRSLQLEAKYNLVQKGVVTSKFTYAAIQFTGSANSTVSYTMLDGLQPGQNLLWTIDFTRRLANALDLSFQYEGRKPGDTRVIHVGRAALRAIL